MDEGAIGASPRRIAAGFRWNPPRGIQTCGIGEGPEDVIVQLVVIRLELSLDGNDESGCDRGE